MFTIWLNSSFWNCVHLHVCMHHQPDYSPQMEHGLCSTMMMIYYTAFLMQQNQMFLPKSKSEVPRKVTAQYTTDSMQEHSHVEYPTILQQSHVGIALLIQTTWKATNIHVTSVHMEQCEFHQTDICEILYLGFLLKLDKITDTLQEGLHQFMWLIIITEMVCVLCEVQMRLRKHLTIEIYCLLWDKCMK